MLEMDLPGKREKRRILEEICGNRRRGPGDSWCNNRGGQRKGEMQAVAAAPGGN